MPRSPAKLDNPPEADYRQRACKHESTQNRNHRGYGEKQKDRINRIITYLQKFKPRIFTDYKQKIQPHLPAGRQGGHREKINLLTGIEPCNAG